MRIEPDLTDLRAVVAAQVRASEHWHPLLEAERLATAAIRERWQAVAGDCERALADAQETYLVLASYVREAIDDLRRRGVESWIAGAVTHQLAFGLAWDVLDDLEPLEEVPD